MLPIRVLVIQLLLLVAQKRTLAIVQQTVKVRSQRAGHNKTNLSNSLETKEPAGLIDLLALLMDIFPQRGID